MSTEPGFSVRKDVVLGDVDADVVNASEFNGEVDGGSTLFSDAIVGSITFSALADGADSSDATITSVQPSGTVISASGNTVTLDNTGNTNQAQFKIDWYAVIPAVVVGIGGGSVTLNAEYNSMSECTIYGDSPTYTGQTLTYLEPSSNGQFDTYFFPSSVIVLVNAGETATFDIILNKAGSGTTNMSSGEINIRRIA